MTRNEEERRGMREEGVGTGRNEEERGGMR